MHRKPTKHFLLLAMAVAICSAPLLSNTDKKRGLLQEEVLIVEKTISGTVKDAEGTPLIGATVQLKGSTTGAVTDINGDFTLEVPDDGAVLVVSYTQY